jgi:superfamily II DNA helicase RecQ
VLHDSTLADIARRRPADLAALAGVPGIGTRKLERYGAGLLEVIETASPDG